MQAGNEQFTWKPAGSPALIRQGILAMPLESLVAGIVAAFALAGGVGAVGAALALAVNAPFEADLRRKQSRA